MEEREESHGVLARTELQDRGTMTSMASELSDSELRKLILESAASPPGGASGLVCSLCQGASPLSVEGYIDRALEFYASRYSSECDAWLLDLALECSSPESGVDDELFLGCVLSLEMQLIVAEVGACMREADEDQEEDGLRP